MKKSVLFVSFAALSLAHSAGVKRQNTAQTTSSADHDHDEHDDLTAVTSCHLHGATQYCMHEATEFVILASATATEDLPSSYTDCHNHATETWCVAPDGSEVEIALEAQITPAPTSADDDGDDHDHDHTGVTGAPAAAPTAITSCHTHSTEIYCLADATEYLVMATPTSSQFPAQYTSCHSHGSDMFCVAPNGEDVEVRLAGAEEEEDHIGDDPLAGGLTCHFHAGVEHCVGAEGENSGAARVCTRTDRDYNIKLRVGLLFVILATSAIGVFGPILLSLVLPPKAYSILLIFKQFGTGVIISTAFVHLFTHANLMFTNECLEGVDYEGTTAAIVMGGLFLSFLVEYCGQRIVHARHAKLVEANHENMSSAVMAEMKIQNEIVSVLILEAGIIFHSLLIGLTLVVAGDSYFLTLFAVILFHQVFEGIALGTRIAALGTASPNRVPHGHLHSHSHSHDIHRISHSEENRSSEPKPVAGSPEVHVVEDIKPVGVSLAKKLGFASAFALITPIGMAIGIGVLDKFNGNNPSTIIAIGTLDALSAGILVWVGVVEMWAEDWMFGGEMTYAGFFTTILGGFGLVLGMAIMSFLGKWA
ncbi:hypothetical protein TWF730_003021 [Orbilia blumenaviensis]|uniref:Zinc transporter n=1 Tax=Orbilia blumenaviensis TaxID=1796055 RepID=A0AAV9UBR2_9PEZI